MKASFEKASFNLPPDEIVSGDEPPFSRFHPPAFLHDFYEKVVAHEAALDRMVTGGFIFGGMFPDMKVGRVPKDYDIYISCEKLIDDLTAIAETSTRSMKEWKNRDDDLEMTLGYDFPINVQNTSLIPIDTKVLGPCIAINGLFGTSEGYKHIDLVIGRKKLHISEFLPFTPAPIMAAGMMLDGSSPRYAFHRDFEQHAKKRIIATDTPTAHLINKGRVKNWVVVPRTSKITPTP